MSDAELKVALIQTFHALPAPEFLERARRFVREAAAGGARLVAFPETCLPGYPAWLDVCRDAALWDHPPVKAVFRRLFEASVSVPGEEVRALGELARECELTLVKRVWPSTPAVTTAGPTACGSSGWTACAGPVEEPLEEEERT